MRRSRRKSSVVAVEVRDSIGNFSTRFSSPSFVKRVEKLSYDQRGAIKSVGFGNLLLIPNQTLSKNLLVELMDRWSCEKRAFVFAQGEIFMTPMDVALVLGLRVIGKPVILKQDEPFSDLEEGYGAVPGKRKITVASLETRLDSLGGLANDDFIRTFLLFTFGTFLFPNTTGTIDTRYLSFLSNLDYVHQYAWGSSVLEDLIMWLSRRKEKSMQYVGGCLLFLQIWFYEHIDMARPSLQNDSLTFPRACRWGSSRPHPRLWVIAEFDKLRDDQIIWELQPTAVELEADIIKEILPTQTHDSKETVSPSETNDLLANLPVDPVVKAEIDSDVDTIDKVQSSEIFNSLKPCLSPDKMNSPTKTDYLSGQELCNKHVESPSTSYGSPRRSSAGTKRSERRDYTLCLLIFKDIAYAVGRHSWDPWHKIQLSRDGAVDPVINSSFIRAWAGPKGYEDKSFQRLKFAARPYLRNKREFHANLFSIRASSNANCRAGTTDKC